MTNSYVCYTNKTSPELFLQRLLRNSATLAILTDWARCVGRQEILRADALTEVYSSSGTVVRVGSHSFKWTMNTATSGMWLRRDCDWFVYHFKGWHLVDWHTNTQCIQRCHQVKKKDTALNLACFWNQVINALSTSCWATFPASNSKQKLKPAAQIMWSVEVNENWFLNRRVPALTTSTAAPICTTNHHKILHASYKLPILCFATCRLVNGLAWSSMVQFVSQDLAAASCLTCPTQMLPWWHLEASNHSICTCNS